MSKPGNGDKETLHKTTRRRKLELNQTQKGTNPLLVDTL